MPEELFRKFYQLIKREWKVAFVSAIIIGFFTHMYVFTNMLPNHDGLINIYSAQQNFKSGRFFLGPMSGITSHFYLPWINGSMSIIYLSVMAVAITELFNLRKTISIVLSAGLIVTFPTVASTFSYMFTSDAYFASNLLAVLAVLITKKYRFGFVLGSIIFFISVGVYQANLTLALTIIAIWLIRELMFNTISLKSFFVHLLRFLSMIGIGMGMYGVLFKGYQFAFKGKITNYQGLDQVGTSSGNLIQPLLKVKDTFLQFFFKGFFTGHINLFEILNVLLVFLLLAIVFYTIIQSKLYKQPVKLMLLFVILISLPILGFIIYFLSPGVLYHMLMVLSLVSYYLLPIIIYDRLQLKTSINKLYSWGATLVLALTIFNFAIISNIAYLNMTLKFEKSYSTLYRVLDRIEQADGYENVTKLAIIGRASVDPGISSGIIPRSIPSMTGAMGEHFLAYPYHYQSMLYNYFGVSFRGASGIELEMIKNSKEYQDMPIWPAKDSIKIFDDIVVIKFK